MTDSVQERLPQDDLRRIATCIHIAVEQSVANDISAKCQKAADLIDSLIRERDAARALALDRAWENINALGGYVAPGDERGHGYAEGIGAALEIIEKLGGKDPLPARALLSNREG